MRSYYQTLLSLTLSLVAVCAAVIIWAQPFSGDLTRIGGLPERWYGWNSAQHTFPNHSNTERRENTPHMLVIGDSFSAEGKWQSVLSEQYTFSFIHYTKFNFAQIDKILAELKPDIVVFESVERFSLGLYTVLAPQMPERSAATCTRQQPDAITITAAELTTALPIKNRETQLQALTDISQGYHLLKTQLRQRMAKAKESSIQSTLNTDKLFSHHRANILLSLNSDLLFSDKDIQRPLQQAQCSITYLSKRLEQQGVNHLFLIIPDKTTSYQEYLLDETLRQKSAPINALLQANSERIINFYTPAKALIAQGLVDFYLPNDTHWGFQGYLLAAKLVQRHLQSLAATPQPQVAKPR